MPMSRRAQSRVRDSVVELRSVHVEGRLAVDELSLFAGAVEPGQRGQLSGDGGSHAAGLFHLPPEQLEAGQLDGESLDLPSSAGAAASPGQPAAGRSVRSLIGGRLRRRRPNRSIAMNSVTGYFLQRRPESSADRATEQHEQHKPEGDQRTQRHWPSWDSAR